MWLEAILTREDLQRVLTQFAPMEFRLGDSGRLLLVDPSNVSLMPDKGLGVVCKATLHWPLLGIDIPVHINELLLLIRPTVEQRAEGEFLVFTLTIEHADVGMLPRILDEKITSMVNEELVKKHVELAWNFSDTLSHVFSLPEALASTATLGLKVDEGRVKATESALGFAVSFVTDVTRRVAGAPDSRSDVVHGDGAAAVSKPLSEAMRPEGGRPTSGSFASLGDAVQSRGAIALLALAAAFALGRVSVGRR